MGKIFVGLVIFFFAGYACGQRFDAEYRLIAWNVEGQTAIDSSSGERGNIETVVRQMEDKRGVDIWALSEAREDFFDRYRAAAAEGETGSFRLIPGTTANRAQRLAIIFDEDQFEIIGGLQELDDDPFDVQLDRSGLRAPLFIKLREKRPSGQTFILMVNHLVRGSGHEGDENNEEQARLLNEWARTQTVPIICVGDFNFDVPIPNPDAELSSSDRGIDELTDGDVFTWIRPTTLVKTQASNRFNTVLDFVFVGNRDRAPGAWSGVSRILARDGDTLATRNGFADTRETVDHRPVDAVFQLVDGPVQPEPDLQQRLERLEQRMERMEGLIQELLDRTDPGPN